VPAPRRLAVLLASGLFALGAAGPAFGQSADHDREGAPSAQAQAQDADTVGMPPPLTPEPQTLGSGTTSGSGSGSGGSGSGGAGAKDPRPPRTAPPDPGAGSGEPRSSGIARTELPNTGADAGVVGLLGAALVLLGIGLRLRVADVRR